MGGKKRAKQFFQKQTNRATKKCWEKIEAKKCEKTFFLFTRIRVQKMGGKNARNNFSRNFTNSASKKCEEKIRRKKVRKKVFYNHTNIVT